MFPPWFRPSEPDPTVRAQAHASLVRLTGEDLGCPMPRGRGGVEAALPVSHPDSRSELLSRYMAEHGLKSTRQRSLIIDTFFSLGGHLSVEELWAKVREQDAQGVGGHRVSDDEAAARGADFAHARNFGDGQTRYEAAIGRHPTTTTSSAPGAAPSSSSRTTASRLLQDKVARPAGRLQGVTSHKMELYGFCESCQRAIAGGDSPRA